MNYLKIDNCNMNNGVGLRVVVWVSGCDHQCHNCFNPETWDIKNGDPITDKIKKEIFNALAQDWCHGITFTGGDPLKRENYDDTMALCKEIKEKYPDKSIWVYTGFSIQPCPIDEDSPYQNIDVICDGAYVENLKSPDKHWVGSSNQRVIDVQKSIAENKIVLYED